MNTNNQIRTKSDAFDTTALAYFTNGEREGNVRVEVDTEGVWVYVETDGDFNGYTHDVIKIETLHFTWDQFNAVNPDMWR